MSLKSFPKKYWQSIFKKTIIILENIEIYFLSFLQKIIELEMRIICILIDIQIKVCDFVIDKIVILENYIRS